MKKFIPLLLPVMIGVGLSSIYFLPSAGEVAQSAVKMDLPSQQAAWDLQSIPPSQEEIETLSKDTVFSKANCYRPTFDRYDRRGVGVPDHINLSIVLSGTDINNSIHRPERCMPAQGHQILSSADRFLKLENGVTVAMKQLKTIQQIPTNEARTEFAALKNVTYYFFVGHDRITNSHLERTLIDMKDRLFKGRDQRWAYVSVTSSYGKLPWASGVQMTLEDAEKMLEAFLIDFAETQIIWDQIVNK